jgi:uncharacterized protein (TIGR02722 family)
MKLFSAPFLVLAGLAFAACSSTRYSDPTEEETINVDWGSTDLQTFSQQMADALLGDPDLSYLANPSKGNDQRVIAYMGGISNETSEHINTRDIMRKLTTALVQSGKIRVVGDEAAQDEIGEQVRFQQGSGRVDPAEAKAFGKQKGAEVVVYGSLSSITKKKDRSLEDLGGKTKDVYYLFVLNCVNIETGEIIWSQEAEINKAQRTSLFGSD